VRLPVRTIGVDPGAGPGPAGIACLDGDTILRLERLPPYTSYGALADRAAAVRRAVGAAAVLVEATAARPFLDLLAAEGLAPVAFVLTGGGALRVHGREVRLPRRSLLAPLERAARRGRLRAAEGCPGGDALVEGLLAAHGGDLAVAVALCLWWQAIARAATG
jgi:hypothetical protein